MLSKRRHLILRALVEEYIATGQPVGSRHIVEGYDIDCSSATVRSELAALEESGHVYQPHVSSGRIPTDAGYRAFVDGLLDSGERLPELDAEEMQRRYIELADEVDGLMHQTSLALAHMTHYVAVVAAPTVSRARIRRIDLLSMSASGALAVLITETGQVLNRRIELAEDTAPESLADIERALNASLDGKRADEVRALRDALDPNRRGDAVVAGILDEVIECLREADCDRLHHGGVPELLALPEFADSARLRPLLGLLEDGLAMLDTLSEVIRTDGVMVRIGSENTLSELGELSLVATEYGTRGTRGVLGVIGPTRMDYPRSIAAVKAAADGLNDLLG